MKNTLLAIGVFQCFFFNFFVLKNNVYQTFNQKCVKIKSFYTFLLEIDKHDFFGFVQVHTWLSLMEKNIQISPSQLKFNIDLYYLIVLVILLKAVF